jgi:hypothetical protein
MQLELGTWGIKICNEIGNVQITQVALLSNHCCNGKATMRFVYCWATFTVNNIKILDVPQQYFYGQFMSPEAIIHAWFSVYCARYFCPILTKFGVSQRILIGAPNIKFPANPSGGSRADSCGQIGRTR